MKLGLMVTTDRHLDAVRGITEAAIARGHEVVIFATDEGTKLLQNASYAALAALKGVAMSFCDHSMQRYGGRPAGLPDAIKSGSQFENAVMNQESDKIVVV